MQNNLVLVTKNLVKPDEPLAYPLYRKDGALLAQKGSVLNESQSAKVTTGDEVYTLYRDLVAFYDQQELRLPNQAANDEQPEGFLFNPIKKLDQAEKELLRVYYNPTHPSSLEKLIWMCARIQSTCSSHPNAAIAKIFLDDKRQYSVQHAIHVATLCELSTRILNWSDEERKSLVASALTMNVSMGILQDRLQHQSKPLNSQQKRMIESHPTTSASLLEKMGVSDKKWLEYVSKHHEMPDGSGYPTGLSNNDIPTGATILRLADRYCAKISGRSYRTPLLPPDAVKDLFTGLDKQLNSETVNIFVKVLGMFPPGTLVKIKSGEIGIVYKSGNKINTPYVKLIQGKNGLKVQSSVALETDEAEHRIVGALSHQGFAGKHNFVDLWSP